MIQDKLSELHSRIEAICKRVNRDIRDITLVLVTKQVGVDSILEAYEAGERDFGENLVRKFCTVPELWSVFKRHTLNVEMQVTQLFGIA